MFGFSCGQMILRMTKVLHMTPELGLFLKEIKAMYFQKPCLWEHLCSVSATKPPSNGHKQQMGVPL